MAEKKAGSEKTVGALVSGLKVIRYLVQARSPVGVSQVARDIQISPSTCFNLLRTLVQ
ncbi:MAG: helix-turn-helix domain-containing protein, partial [Gammaproteobacteria bacterium]|nr:helix-turn-helix domain-containing protein [Gammaproteobacteria bacterium]